MKIGLSFSRCVRDILEGRVDINEVLVIIAHTRVDLDQESDWKLLWNGYSQPGTVASAEWQGLDEHEVKKVAMQLWHRGLIHQPRRFGVQLYRRSEYWLETVLPSSELERNPAARAAWDEFQTLAGLTNVKLDREYQ